MDHKLTKVITKSIQNNGDKKLGFKLKSLCLCVYDMGRAISLYEQLLQMKFYKENSIYSIFLFVILR